MTTFARGRYSNGDTFNISISYWAYMDAVKEYGQEDEGKVGFWYFISKHQDTHNDKVEKQIVSRWADVVFIRVT